MRLSKVTVKNFKSIKDSDIEFPNNFNMLVGKNGAGKTSVIEAIMFGLFGRSPNGQTLTELIGLRNANSVTEVILEIEDGSDDYVIHRRIDMTSNSSLTIMRNGTNLVFKTKADGLSFIESQILGMTYYEFMKSSYFSAEDTTFMSLTPVKRVDFLEEFFNLDWDGIVKRISERMRELERSSDVLSAKKEESNNFINDSNEKIARLKKSAPIIWKNDPDVLRDRYQLLEDKLRKIQSQMSIQQGFIKNIDLQISEFGNIRGFNKCPTCGAPINQIHIAKHLKKLNYKRQTHAIKLKNLNLKAMNLGARVDKAEALYNATKNLRTQINTLESIRNDAKSKNASYSINLAGVTQLINHVQVLKNMTEKKSVLRLRTLGAALRLLEIRINKYLKVLPGGFTITFGGLFHVSISVSEVITSDSSASKYHTLSLGERKRVDIAVSLALRDLIREGVGGKNGVSGKLALTIMDEVMTNLDAEGSEAIVDMIKLSMKPDDSILLTSHDIRITSTNPDGVLMVVKKDDGSGRPVTFIS